MTKISTLTSILFPLVAILLCALSQCLAALSDKQLCYDPNCSEIISLAKTIIPYRSNDREVMSFDVNVEVKVFSKGAGKRTDLWGIEINGKRGFAPKSFLNEYKVLQRVLTYEVPVYPFTNEVLHNVQNKKSESTGKVYETHPLLKDKLSDNDNEIHLLSENPVNKNIQEEKVKTKKDEFIEKTHEAHPSSKEKSFQDDDKKSMDKSIQESDTIKADNILSYEVIDGTTLHFDDKPSVQPSFVTEAMHATASLNEHASLSHTDPKKNFDNDKKETKSNKKLQQDKVDSNSKFEGIQFSVDINKETSTKVQLESSETMINSTADIVNKNDDALVLHENDKSEDKLSKSLESEEKPTDIIEDNTKEEIEEDIEEEGIFASFARTLTMLSGSRETTFTESTIESSSESATENELQKQTSKYIEVEDTATEANISTTQRASYSNIDPSLISKNDMEIQQEIIIESIENAKNSDETKTEEETISLENVTFSKDVPLSNNFVHKDADEPANDLPMTSFLGNDKSTSIETDVDSYVEDIKIQKSSEEKKITENIESKAIHGEESTILSDVQETAAIKSVSTQSSNDVEQKLQENNKKYLKNTGNEKPIDQVDKIVAPDKISEINSRTRSSVEETPENVAEKISADNHEENAVNEALNYNIANVQYDKKLIVHTSVNKNDNLINDDSFENVSIESNEFSGNIETAIDSEQSVDSNHKSTILEETINEISQERNLSNIQDNLEYKNIENQIDLVKEVETLPEYGSHINSEDKVLYQDKNIKEDNQVDELESKLISDQVKETLDRVCLVDQDCTTENIETFELIEQQKAEAEIEQDYMVDVINLDHNYWKTIMYLGVTALTTLIFTLGYYYIENTRRDGQFIKKINELEKQLWFYELSMERHIEKTKRSNERLNEKMQRQDHHHEAKIDGFREQLFISMEKCEMLSESLESAKEKLRRIEDESHESNEMIVSLKAELEVSQNTKAELEDQIAILEKDLEQATEAGLELERMLREVLSSNNEVNPLAQTIEDMQARLDAQQAANESLANTLNFRVQEIETLSADLASVKKKCEEVEAELSGAQNELTTQKNLKNNMEQTLTDKIYHLEVQVKELSTEKSSLCKELRGKEIEAKELTEVINQVNSNNLDLEKLYDVSRIKTEMIQLREERDELKMRLNDVEGAHQLLEEHMKLVKEEVAVLSDQCKVAEKEKKDAETRLEVLSKFFKDKETERQKEEAIWLQKQGEVASTVERIHTMQNEIQNYKQQVEMLKREIVDQEREYKNQICALETKAHEQWVVARQNERRLEESKAEAGQLRNRLTLIEKNLNDSDSETKLHRLEANGETATSPSFFMGASSSSPVMFSGPPGVPPPLPSYLPYPPYLPPLPHTASGLPPYDITQRPPPLGGRLSSPPPMPPLPPATGRYENAGSPPPPLPPHLLPFNRHRSPPPPFGGDIPPPPPLDTADLWGEESLPPLRNSGFHPHQREQRARNHKGSLHSSGESLDKAHHGKV